MVFRYFDDLWRFVEHLFCVNLCFCVRPESASEASILLLADEYVRQILDGRNAEETAVHIMGEFTLCYAVICRLQSLGVRCVASCTCRDVVYAADGTKQVRFHFTRFREYSK